MAARHHASSPARSGSASVRSRSGTTAEFPLAQHTAAGEPGGSSNPLVDHHVVYALAAIMVALTHAGDTGVLGRRWASLPPVRLGRIGSGVPGARNLPIRPYQERTYQMIDKTPGPSQPGGTVYGRGGVDAREPRPGLLTRTHPAVTAGVSLAIIAVMVLAYVIWRSGADEPARVSATASAPASATASATATGAPPAELAAGSWFVSPLGDQRTFLTADGEFAALSGTKAALTVVAGLADESCFSFRNDDDKYLRHFDYRLRFDAQDDSDLFRLDATFCKVAGLKAGTVRLRSKNYLDHVIHRRGTELYIDKPDESDKFVADSSFGLRQAS
ncbi:AbfB domain-containing protein [Actinoplanes sp. NPDC051494]|uniref:AbfB domain-containing protein n=1 Tax=Actinoplanes sp. NPDC051494 TaxID=3363907 RepID=UPI003790C02E